MWGRRISRDSDAAMAARRRLAAIAAEFDRGSGPTGGSPPAPPAPLPTPLRTRSGSEGGRHRSEDGVFDWGRWRLSAHHVAVLALVLAALVALASWWALRSRPHDEPVPLASRQISARASTPDPGTSPNPTPVGGVPAPTSATSTAESSFLVIDVAGKVRHPGIVELPSGSRVVDALAAAGGARPGVRTAGLNLARPLVDGEQVVVGLAIPVLGPPAPPASGPTSTGPAPASIDLNTATEPELETLPGIGPVTAQSILDWRTENGSFTRVDQLLDVSGIGAATLADVEPYVHV